MNEQTDDERKKEWFVHMFSCPFQIRRALSILVHFSVHFFDVAQNDDLESIRLFSSQDLVEKNWKRERERIVKREKCE